MYPYFYFLFSESPFRSFLPVLNKKFIKKIKPVSNFIPLTIRREREPLTDNEI